MIPAAGLHRPYHHPRNTLRCEPVSLSPIMAAPRASSLQSPPKPLFPSQTQSYTLLATYTLLASQQRIRRLRFLGLGLLDLRSECKKRVLSPSGTKHELIDRLASHDALQARAMSIAMKRITNDQTKKGTPR